MESVANLKYVKCFKHLVPTSYNLIRGAKGREEELCPWHWPYLGGPGSRWKEWLARRLSKIRAGKHPLDIVTWRSLWPARQLQLDGMVAYIPDCPEWSGINGEKVRVKMGQLFLVSNLFASLESIKFVAGLEYSLWNQMVSVTFQIPFKTLHLLPVFLAHLIVHFQSCLF